MSKLKLVLAVVAAAFPVAAIEAERCKPGPMPSPEAGVNWTSANWPQGEAIRFSARPAFGRHAYVVQISRDSPDGDATVHLVKLLRERSCNRWDREQEWSFPLGAGEANLFFERIEDVEMRWQPSRGLVTDGTGFGYEHRHNGQTKVLRLSAAATGQSGYLSDLIISVLAVAGGEIPKNADWYE